jgi:hypothetical protein
MLPLNQTEVHAVNYDSETVSFGPGTGTVSFGPGIGTNLADAFIPGRLLSCYYQINEIERMKI